MIVVVSLYGASRTIGIVSTLTDILARSAAGPIEAQEKLTPYHASIASFSSSSNLSSFQFESMSKQHRLR